MSHFGYHHLPASGLGHRDPRRPHVTGGIGGGTPVFVGVIGGIRDPEYQLRDEAALERMYEMAERMFIPTVRMPIRGSRSPETRGRMAGGSRGPERGARGPTDGLRDPENNIRDPDTGEE